MIGIALLGVIALLVSLAVLAWASYQIDRETLEQETF